MSLTTTAAAAPSARCIVVADPLPTLRGRTVASVLPSWPSKDPLQTAIYQFDFAPLLRGRAIVAVSYEADGVTIAGAPFRGSVVSLIAEGGVDAAVARVQVEITCDDGMIEVAAALLPINAVLTLPGFTASQPDFLRLNGDILTISGTPVSFGRTP